MTRSVVRLTSQSLFSDKNEFEAIAVPKSLIAFPDVTLYTIVTKKCILLALVKISQKTAKKALGYTFTLFTYVNVHENVIFLYERKGNGQNYPKSLFLNAFIKVEISFLQIGSKYS